MPENSPVPEIMTIHQLSKRSGLPVRRIRHYIAEGLLPPPMGRGRAAHYGQHHVARLEQIQSLRDVNLGLDSIRRRLGTSLRSGDEGAAYAENWSRWQIVPGVELHARSELEPDVASMVRVLVRVARQLMTEDQEDHTSVSMGEDQS